MTDKASLIALKERVDSATGPDRELDAHISVIDGLNFTWCDYDTGSCCGDCQSPGCGAPLGLIDERNSYPADWREDERLPLYTASVDAALALVERVLPGCGVLMAVSPRGAIADISTKPLGEVTDQSWIGHGRRPTLPLAIVSAALAALIAEGA